MAMGRRAKGTGISLRGGPIGEPGRGVVYWGLMCRKRLWRQAPLSIGILLECMGVGWGFCSPGTLKVEEGLWK
jgi:hypothetical protein